jgi:hypothetical protein
MMIKHKVIFTSCSLALVSSLALAGVSMSQWTEGTSRYCKYSDGDVIKIDFGATCPSTK